MLNETDECKLLVKFFVLLSQTETVSRGSLE